MLADIMNLGMTIVARRNAIIRPCLRDLFEFQAAVMAPGFRQAGLQKAAATAAAVIVGPVRGHIDEIFFTHNRFDNIAQFFGNGITQGLADQLTWILDRKFYF